MDAKTSASDRLESWLTPTADPAWQLIESGYDPAREAEIEACFAIGNGLLGVRASRAISRGATWVTYQHHLNCACSMQHERDMRDCETPPPSLPQFDFGTFSVRRRYPGSTADKPQPCRGDAPKSPVSRAGLFAFGVPVRVVSLFVVVSRPRRLLSSPDHVGCCRLPTTSAKDGGTNEGNKKPAASPRRAVRASGVRLADGSDHPT
jgi:hypothetical protein